MRLVDADALKKNGFVVPKTLKKGDMYLEVKAEDMPKNYNDLCRKFFVNDEIIDAIPTVDAEPTKHGRWKRSKYYPRIIICDECGEPYELSNSMDHWVYCPSCGARMDEVEE
jgi:hypothetical protein